jgi:predicted small lipoprotein YifL
MKPCRTRLVLWLCVVLAGAGTILSACGQKGDLYLPEEVDAQEREDR